MTTSLNTLTVQVAETPEMLATLSEEDVRHVTGRLVELATLAYGAWMQKSNGERLAKHHEAGDRLLSTKELAAKMSCSPATLVRGWKVGRYPFILKDGGRLVGSESGLERWIAARTKRQPLR